MELLIVALMTSIIAAAGMEFFIRVNQQYVSQDGITEMQQNVRASLQEICREMRMAGFNTPDTVNAYSIANMSGSPDSLTVNRDTLSIQYYVDESDTLHPALMKSVNGNPEIYADDISDLQIGLVGPGTFQISITAKSFRSDDQIMGGDKFARTLTQVISLRNSN
jgi:hypothetical protein